VEASFAGFIGLGLLAVMFWKVVRGGWTQTWRGYLKTPDPVLCLATLLSVYLVMIYFKGIRLELPYQNAGEVVANFCLELLPDLYVHVSYRNIHAWASGRFR